VQRGKVVITGASTGIGDATATRLKAAGFEVLAGVRKEEDAERLRAKGVQPVIVDITNAEQVKALADTVGERLDGLVNNAGIAIAAPLEFLPIDELRRQLEVNVIGQVAVTQALLPALRAAKGRVVNISSVGGKVALPLAGAYAASKFALEAISDSLRRELRSQGVDVIVVEPGGIKTPIWETGTKKADEIAANAPAEAEQLYGDLVDAIRRETRDIAENRGLLPDAAAEVVEKALTTDKPRTRYAVGRDARGRIIATRFLPDRVFDRAIARALKP
jgi:NAD(P)-dependent dehydrogenase (short-subunit alcohol dehydrogenase family)